MREKMKEIKLTKCLLWVLGVSVNALPIVKWTTHDRIVRCRGDSVVFPLHWIGFCKGWNEVFLLAILAFHFVYFGVR